MLSSMLLDLVERNSPGMAAAWRRRIKESPYSRTYQRFSDAELERRARGVYDTLGKWLDRGATMEEIGAAYLAVGSQRYQEGFPLCEVQYGLYCTKKVLWDHILSEGILNSALEAFQAMDLLLRLQNFFDLASYHIIRGWLRDLVLALERSGTVDHAALQCFFPDGSFVLDLNPNPG